MKKVYKRLLAVVILAVWLYVITKIDGYFSLQGAIMAVLMSATTFVILACVKEIIRRIRNKEPLVVPPPPRPRKLPLWYRILSKIIP